MLATGASALIKTSTLPAKDWKVHSGFAPATGENVHSLKSQKIEGTGTVVIQAETGAQLSVTQGEAEVFAVDYLKDLGYKIQVPRSGAARTS
jgi:hypothetical protein